MDTTLMASTSGPVSEEPPNKVDMKRFMLFFWGFHATYRGPLWEKVTTNARELNQLSGELNAAIVWRNDSTRAAVIMAVGLPYAWEIRRHVNNFVTDPESPDPRDREANFPSGDMAMQEGARALKVFMTACWPFMQQVNDPVLDLTAHAVRDLSPTDQQILAKALHSFNHLRTQIRFEEENRSARDQQDDSTKRRMYRAALFIERRNRTIPLRTRVWRFIRGI